MAKKSKVFGANITVPQSRDEAAEAVARIGVINREVARREADMNDRLAVIKAAVEEALAPQRSEAESLTEGLKIWAEANRRELTAGDKTKTVDLGAGLIKWRLRPARVTIRGKVEAVIASCKAMGFKFFVRTAEEIDREAMLKFKDKARTVPGVSIGSDGEDFVVEPFEVELAGVV